MTKGAITYDPVDDSWCVTPPDEDDYPEEKTETPESAETAPGELPF